MIKFITTTFFLLLISYTSNAQSIMIRNAREALIPVAIQGFVTQPETSDLTELATNVESRLTASLLFSRLFKLIPSDAHLVEEIESLEQLRVDPWRQVGAQHVIRGRVRFNGSNAVLEGYVFDVSTGETQLEKTYRQSRSDWRSLAHQFGDDIVEQITGTKGIFSTKIAFSYTPPNSDGNERQIWVMDFDGSNPRPLVQNGRTNLFSEWTKDGKSIYFTSSSVRHWHLWKTDLNANVEQVTNFSGSALGPKMMPNGEEMLVSLSKDGNADLYLLNLEGEQQKRLTRRGSNDIAPAPNPDGTQFCFSSSRKGGLHIFRYNLKDPSQPDRITPRGLLNDSCAWHPQEDLLLFSGLTRERNFDIYIMNSQGHQLEPLTYDAQNNETPRWSPDGRLIVYSSEKTDRREIYVMRSDGSKSKSLTEDLPGKASHPAWSPRLGYD